MIVYAIIIAVFIFAGILLGRTWLYSGFRDAPEAPKFTDIDRQKAAERLGSAISYETVSRQHTSQLDDAQFKKQHEFIERSFPLIHKHLKKEVINQCSLLYTWEGRDKFLKPIMLTSHLDVVPVESGTEDNWLHPPFSGVIRDGYVYGRGAMDVQCGVMGILESVEWLLRNGYEPERTIYIGFGHDEEVDGDRGAYAISELLEERGISMEYILDEGLPIAHDLFEGIKNPIALIAIAEKGYLSLELSVQAAGGHSSVPQGKTSIAELSEAIEKLENNPMPARLDGVVRYTFESMAPSLPFGYRLAVANMWLFRSAIKRMLAKLPPTNASMRTTTATTIFESGFKENVLPTKAKAIINFRIHPNDSVESVLKHVRKTINSDRIAIRTLPGYLNPSPVSDIEHINYKTLETTIREVFPDVTVSPSLMVGATDARHYTKLTRNLYRFLPLRADESDLDRVHGTNERLSIKNYEEMIRFYIQLLINSAVTKSDSGEFIMHEIPKTSNGVAGEKKSRDPGKG